MKTLLLLISVFAQTIVQAQKKTGEEGINCSDCGPEKQGYVIIYGKDRPDLNYPPDGRVEEGNYVDDRKEGTWIKYHRDGITPKLKGTYENNRPKGNYEKYYPSGVLKEKGFFERNRYCDTLFRFYENGNPEYIAAFDEKGRETGVVRYFFDSGQLEYQYTIRDGILVDTCYHYARDGEVIEISKRSHSHYEQRMEVIYAKPDSSGYRASNPGVTAKSDRKAPVIADSLKQKDADPLKFNPNGENTICNENKEIWQKGLFKEGRLWDGKVWVYDADGILLKVQVYKNGLYHSDAQL